MNSIGPMNFFRTTDTTDTTDTTIWKPGFIANSSLSIELFYFVADQERRERNPDNKRDQLKTAFPRRAYYIAQSLHNTRTFIIIYTLAKL